MLSEVLKNKGIRKIDLARNLGVSPSLVTHWCAKRTTRKPGWKNLLALAQLLQMEVSETMELFNNDKSTVRPA